MSYGLTRYDSHYSPAHSLSIAPPQAVLSNWSFGHGLLQPTAKKHFKIIEDREKECKHNLCVAYINVILEKK